MLWGRVDTAMIVLFIAGSFTPIAFHALDGSWRVWSLVMAWAVSLTGAGLGLSPMTAPRWLRTAGYLGVGWLMMVPFVKIAAALPVAGNVLIVAGGILYTVGGVVYAAERPDPAPLWFGYHEIFHLFVIAASVCHYVAILNYVI
jgi:hemolysin III